MFLTSEKYRMRAVIGHTIFSTSEKNGIGFSAFRRGFPAKVGMFTTFAIEDQENENTKKKTQQNVALLKEFLTLKNESRLMEEIPPKELNFYISKFLITVRKKDN